MTAPTSPPRRRRSTRLIIWELHRIRSQGRPVLRHDYHGASSCDRIRSWRRAVDGRTLARAPGCARDLRRSSDGRCLDRNRATLITIRGLAIHATITIASHSSPVTDHHTSETSFLQRSRTMSKPQDLVRIELTKAQQENVKATTGKDAEAIELTVQELEERISPIHFRHGLAK
jgi:hypothetical protein